MPKINTVLGSLPVDKLGFTVVHEHISFQFGGLSSDATLYPYDRSIVKERAFSVFKTMKAAGVHTLVDCTPNDCTGRDPELFQELSRETGVNIICATGLYFEEPGAPSYWKIRQSNGYDISAEIYQLMKTEITRGIGKTQIKAGVIKVGSGQDRITSYEQAVFKAAARSQRELGVPIMTHVEGLTMGPEQADFLINAGANPGQIAIGHMNNSLDLNYYLEVLKRPDVYLSFDRTGIGDHQRQETIAKNIAGLIKQGYLERILLSTDAVITFSGRPFQFRDTSYPNTLGTHPEFIATGFRDLLHDRKVTDAQFDVLTVQNPRRLYSG